MPASNADCTGGAIFARAEIPSATHLRNGGTQPRNPGTAERRCPMWVLRMQKNLHHRLRPRLEEIEGSCIVIERNAMRDERRDVQTAVLHRSHRVLEMT